MKINLNFKEWIKTECGTAAVFDPKKKSNDWLWAGAPGPSGVSPKENPIGVKNKNKKL